MALSAGVPKLRAAGVGTHAISLEHGLTNDYLLETMTNRAILQMGHKVYVAAHHTKLGQVSTVLVAPVEKVHTIVTENLTSAGFIEILKAKNMGLIVV